MPSRRHQIRRQDAARGQNGDPQQRPSGYRKVHLCKAKEEKKAYTLVEAGYDASLDGEAYSSSFSRTPTTRCAPRRFMRAAQEDGEWWTKHVFSGQPRTGTRRATCCARSPRPPTSAATRYAIRYHRQSLAPVQEHGAHQRLQPCSEYMFLDDSACNLSSLNLMKLSAGRPVRRRGLRHAVDTLILAQEIIVDNASYPTEKIGGNSHVSARWVLASPTWAHC